MKTAISVPDDIFEDASKQAAELGVSRSEFFARAARRYLDELAARSLSQQVDDALLTAGCDDSAAAAAPGRPPAAGHRGRVVTRRGSICWADLSEPRGSKPAKQRPALIIQADPFNASVTLDKADLDAETGHLPSALMSEVDRGLRRVLGL